MTDLVTGSVTDKVFISTTGSGLARATYQGLEQSETETLLSGVNVCCLAADPLDKQRVYAGTQEMGVLRSDDRGRNWRSVGLSGHFVKAIAASPTQRDVVYAGVKPAALFVSTDGGASWEELTAFRRIPGRWFWRSPAEKPYIGYVQAIALSPVDPDMIVVGVEAGAVVLSRDRGKNWSTHQRGALRDCHSLIFHVTDDQWIYEAGGTGGGAAYSRDGGQRWISAGKSLDRHYGWAVAADAVDPAIWYVSVSPGPFKAHSANDAQAYLFRHDGMRWQRLAGGLPQPLAHMPYALLTEPGVGGSLYAGLSNGDIWYSCDHGEKWTQLPLHLTSIHRTLLML